MPELSPPLRRIADRAKLIVRGYAFTPRRGDLTDRQIALIRKFIQANYLDMYRTWKDFGGQDFYRRRPSLPPLCRRAGASPASPSTSRPRSGRTANSSLVTGHLSLRAP